MPADDLVLNVRQIGNYPPTADAFPGDLIVLQRGGLGGPFLSITAQDFVATALATGGGPLDVSTGFAPADAVAPQIFTDNLVVNLGATHNWNCYFPSTGGAFKYTTNGAAAAYGYDGNSGFSWSSAPPGAAGETVALGELMQLRPNGQLILLEGQLNLPRDPMAPTEAATAGWVAANTVASFNGRTGPVTLGTWDILNAGGAPIWSPVFGGTPCAPTPEPSSNSTRIATTAFVETAINEFIANVLASEVFVASFNGRQGVVTLTTADVTAVANGVYAPLDSPNFTGYATSLTAPVGTATGQIATTAFVMNAVADSVTGVVSYNGRTGLVLSEAADVTSVGGALLASPAFTGTPTAPTAAPGTNTTQIATTAFVMGAAFLPLTGGTVSINHTAGFTTDGFAVAAVTQLGQTAPPLYSPTYGGVPMFDTYRAVTVVPAGSTTANTSGVGSYVINRNPLNSGVGSSVGLFSFNIAAANNAGVWGLNTVCTDSQAQTVNAQTGNVLIGYEVDFNVCSPNSQITGVMLTGASKAQPAGGTGFLVASLGGSFHWTQAFATNSGAAQVGLSLGAMAVSGSTISSQPINLNYFNSSGAIATYGLQAGGDGTLYLNGGGVHVLGANGLTVDANVQVNGVITVSGNLSGQNASFTGTLSCNSGVFNVSTVNGGGSPAIGLLDSANATHSQYYWDAGSGIVGLNNVVGGGALTIGQSGGGVAISGDISANPGPGHNFIVTPGLGFQAGGGPWQVLSDARIKTVVADYDEGLDELLALRPVRYRYNGNDSLTKDEPGMNKWAADAGIEFIGLVAQEAEQVMPHMVTKRSGFIGGLPVDDLRSLNANALTFALINAVKQLAARVATLEAVAA